MTTPSQQQGPGSHRELLFPDFPNEFASTRRLLERYPDGKGDWKPDPKSRSLGELASHVTDVVGLGAAVLETDDLEATERPRSPQLDSARALLDRFDENVARVTQGMQRVRDDALAQSWTLRFHGHPVAAGLRRDMLRTLLMSHLVHHRAQLAGYYRALGIPVPSIYGPSADEQPSGPA